MDKSFEEQMAELQASATAAANRLAAARHREGEREKSHVQKENVSSEEYVRRLQQSLLKDSSIVREVSRERIAQSLQQWRAKVGPTFADAHTTHEHVLKRAAWLGTPQQSRTSLLMAGNVGTGKTWTAYAYLNKALQEGKVTAGQILTGSEMSLLGHTTRAGFKAEDKWDQILATKNRIFFIDDVGKATYSNHEARHAAWYSLIDHIYAHQLTIIITSNLNPSGRGAGSLENWVGHAVYDRLMALVGGNFIPSELNKRSIVWNEGSNPGGGEAPPQSEPHRQLPPTAPFGAWKTGQKGRYNQQSYGNGSTPPASNPSQPPF